jgi:hypothetical protein
MPIPSYRLSRYELEGGLQRSTGTANSKWLVTFAFLLSFSIDFCLQVLGWPSYEGFSAEDEIE